MKTRHITYYPNGDLEYFTYKGEYHFIKNATQKDKDEAFKSMVNPNLVLNEFDDWDDMECTYCGKKNPEWYDKKNKEYLCIGCLKKYGD